MKRFLKRSLVCMLISLILFNFISPSMINYSYGFIIDDIFSGLIGLITWIPRAIVMAALTGINLLVSGFARLGLGDIDGYGTLASDLFVTPFHIFFNKIAILDVNFLNFDGVNGTVLKFRTAVAGWYYSLRLVACMILVVILIYIGIRMTLSTIAEEKAKYKQMLVSWVTSLALLFLLHYIIIFILGCNTALIKAIEGICSDLDLTKFIERLTGQALGLNIASAIAAMILYAIIMYQTVSFLFAYVKRMLTTGFLIMIAPLITITYSIDKVGDNKAQALNTWLKEFSFNILIQPFHCILFGAFASVAFELVGVDSWTEGSSLAEMILAVACITFIKTGESLVRSIFDFKDSGNNTFARGAEMAAAATGFTAKAGVAVGVAAGKAKNFIGSNNDKLAKVDKNGNLTKRGEKIADQKAKKQLEKEKKSNPKLNEADAYERLYDNEKTNMTKRYTNKQHKATRKREEAINKKLEKKYGGKEGVEKFSNRATDKEWEKARAEAGKEVDADTAKRKKITSASGNAAKSIAKYGTATVLAVAKGANDGNIAGIINTLQFAKGIDKGYAKETNQETNKTLGNNISNSAQAVSNMNEENEDFDISAKTYALDSTLKNGGYDNVEEKLDQILERLQALTGAQKDNFNSDVRKQLLVDPSGFNMDFLNSLADKYNVPEDKREETLNGMKQFATLLADANYARTINTATSTGISLEDIAQSASATNNANNNITTNNTNNSTNTTVNNTSEGPTAAEVAEELKDKINVDINQVGTTVNQADIDELNNKTENINRNMKNIPSDQNDPIQFVE